jgi:hypothetical protein
VKAVVRWISLLLSGLPSTRDPPPALERREGAREGDLAEHLTGGGVVEIIGPEGGCVEFRGVGLERLRWAQGERERGGGYLIVMREFGDESQSEFVSVGVLRRGGGCDVIWGAAIVDGWRGGGGEAAGGGVGGTIGVLLGGEVKEGSLSINPSGGGTGAGETRRETRRERYVWWEESMVMELTVSSSPREREQDRRAINALEVPVADAVASFPE